MRQKHTSADTLPSFVSRQVTEAKRFFLNLSPDRRSALEVVCGGVEKVRPDYRVQREDFPFFAIELVAEGQGTLTTLGKQYPLTPGSVFAYGPGVAHTIQNKSENPMRKYYVDFVGARAQAVLREAGLMSSPKKFPLLTVGALHELCEVFEILIREGLNHAPQNHSISQTLVQLLSQKIGQLQFPAGRSLPQAYATYERIRHYIDEHFLSLQTMQEVAQACDLTTVHLSRLFGRFSDCGAYHYLLRRKMNFAAGLLMNDGMLVKEVAKQLEFADAFQFSRAFKRVFGIPPSALHSQAAEPKKS